MMNALPPIDGLEPRQERLIRRMVLLSLVVHVALFFLGLTISPLFPSMQVTPPVFVELTDAPMPQPGTESPAPTPPVALAARAESGGASSRVQDPTRPGAKETVAARRWLEQLDAGISKPPDAPVARKGRNAGGIPVRSWTSEGPVKPGDFAPGAGPERTAALEKHIEELEARMRRSGRPTVGFGRETEASMMFGGTGGTGGEPIPAWIRDMIRKRVRDYLPELEKAYTEAIRRNPDLRGKLLVRFRIDPAGKIQHAESVEGDLRDPEFVDSVLKKIRNWTFEPVGGRAVEVLYPLVFIAPS
jgi:outer membrane biosynthesis protein TonB